MNVLTWKHLFEPHILARGEYYYFDGAVTKLEENDNGYAAVVVGNDAYEVEIEIEGDEIVDMTCTCPYAAEGNRCKHMAAVLYAVSARDDEEAAAAHAAETFSVDEDMDAFIDGLSPEILRAVVKRLVTLDENAKTVLMAYCSDGLETQQVQAMTKEVERIIHRYEDADGSINYSQTGLLTDELRAFLSKKASGLIVLGRRQEAFELTNFAFNAVDSLDMDFADVDRAYFERTCCDIWMQLLDTSGPQERDRMFQWFYAHQPKRIDNGYMYDAVEGILYDEFHEPYMLEKKLERLDQLIANQKQDPSAEYAYKLNVYRRLDLMKDLGFDEDAFHAYRRAHWTLSMVRMQEIDELLAEGNDDEAIEVLKESKLLDHDKSGLVASYSNQLLALYARRRDEQAYKEELIFNVFACYQGDLMYLHALKSLSSDEEWKLLRGRFFQEGFGVEPRLALMEEEGFYDRMLDIIKGSRRMDLLDLFEDELKENCPEQVRDLYIHYVCEAAKTTSDRRHYRGIIAYLKKLEDYPDGQKKAAAIAKKWRSSYARRRAMMEELANAGF